MEKELRYQVKNGPTVPMFEADYDLAFEVFKKDCRKAKIADPAECIEAKGICRLRNVEEAHVGGGRDAYVVFKQTPTRQFRHALHFIVAAESKRVRDKFEITKGVERQVLWLRAPPPSQFVKNRRALVSAHAKKRRVAQKAGIKLPTGKKRVSRRQRLGVSPRPHATIKEGIISLFD
jgi:hypothetical protein